MSLSALCHRGVCVLRSVSLSCCDMCVCAFCQWGVIPTNLIAVYEFVSFMWWVCVCFCLWVCQLYVMSVCDLLSVSLSALCDGCEFVSFMWWMCVCASVWEFVSIIDGGVLLSVNLSSCDICVCASVCEFVIIWPMHKVAGEFGQRQKNFIFSHSKYMLFLLVLAAHAVIKMSVHHKSCHDEIQV